MSQIYAILAAAAVFVVAVAAQAAELRDASTIDRDGLHVTNLRLLRQALAGLEPGPDVALVDGFPLGDGSPPHTAVIGGDRRSACIAAASVVAKATRDRLMAGPADERLAVMHLISDLTTRDFGGYHAVLAVHAEGSIEAEKMQILRSHDTDSAMALARRLAGL